MTNDNKVPHSRSNSRQSIDHEIEDDSPIKTHKYIIEASVLKDSWPLSPSNWEFVNKLKESENAELKVFSKDSESKDAKPSVDPKAAASNASAAKDAKNSKAPAAKGKSGKVTAVAASRPVSSAFDVTKPHWTLRWVAEESAIDCIEIKKDTDRVDEIKSLKRAWESVEAGRAAKAAVARETFLKANQVRVDNGATDDEAEADAKPAGGEEEEQITVRKTSAVKPDVSFHRDIYELQE